MKLNNPYLLIMDKGLKCLADKIVTSKQHMKDGVVDNGTCGSVTVNFRSLDQLILNPADLKYMCEKMVEHLNINKAVFLDSRGYLFVQIAEMLDLGVVKACKKPKLANMVCAEYGTEYSRSKVYILANPIWKYPKSGMAPLLWCPEKRLVYENCTKHKDLVRRIMQ